MKKLIVIYYSFDGNTKEAALRISQELGADIEELVPEKEIPREGAKKFMVGGRQAMFGECPPIKPVRAELSAYDGIILGTPVWAGKCAPPINTFLKEHDCADKVFAVFTSSGGGDSEKCMKALGKKLPDIRYSVPLADRKSPASSENESRLSAFIEKVKHD